MTNQLFRFSFVVILKLIAIIIIQSVPNHYESDKRQVSVLETCLLSYKDFSVI